MAADPSKLVRTEDTSGTLRNVKTFEITEETETRHIQGVAITDPELNSEPTAASIVTLNGSPVTTKGALVVTSSPERPTSTRLFGTGDPSTNPQTFTNTTAVNSSEVDTTNARGAVLYIRVEEAGTLATSELVFRLQYSPLASPGANDWYTYSRDFWADLRYSNNVTYPTAEAFDVPFGSIGKRMRLQGQASGTVDGTNHYEVWAYVTLIN